MSKKGGALLWNRMRIPQLDKNTPTTLYINTGLIQPNTGFENYSKNEPPMGPSMALPDPLVPPLPDAPFGEPPPSRIQVVPLAPLDKWTDVIHSEPFVDTTTGVIWVKFDFEGGTERVENLNVLFWDPHSIVGPGEADTYNPPPPPPM